MYILLLCMRYLRTRFLAMACIISVMLGVATLIVVNSVMNGFSTKLRDRLHSLLSDVVIEAQGLEGFANPNEKMERILRDPYLKDQIEAMAPTMEVFAMLQYDHPHYGQRVTRPVHLVGIDPKSREKLGGLKDHLVNCKNLPESTFELPADIQKKVAERINESDRQLELLRQIEQLKMVRPGEPPPPSQPVPLQATQAQQVALPKGAFVGFLLASYRFRDSKTDEIVERYVLDRGSDITLTTVGGDRLEPVYKGFVVADYFKSDMSEYDSNYVYVPLDTLQEMRHMPNRVTSIQIKLKDYDKSGPEVKKALERLFALDNMIVNTWEDKQGPLLSAISVEKGILNLLLFLIIAVAGFGILAIFSMIVTEKTRDIGILKALGASNGGVMKIFLGYGLLLGLVGALLGTSAGIWLTVRINEVEKFLTDISGKQLFPRDIYYFSTIPTDIQPLMVVLVNFGAVLIAVTFSVLPALKAALLHPVRALRYE